MRQLTMMVLFAAASLVICPPRAKAQAGAGSVVNDGALRYIDTSFENASPLDWSIDAAGEVQINLMYDHERESPNRAAGHWHFAVEAPKGSAVTLVLNRFENIYNGRPGIPVSKSTVAHISTDGRKWEVVEPEFIEDNRLRLKLTMPADKLFVARLPPYRLSDLERLKDRIAKNPLVKIEIIGKTVEGRELEMIRIGKADAPHSAVLRARAHAWEPGGNWAIEGLCERLLRGDADAGRWLERYCVYLLPIANKDGVARGRTRFNSCGKDLNRNWDKPADAALAPENHVFEQWLERQIAAGRRPGLAIDYHNDENGRLHVSRPDKDAAVYAAKMDRFAALLGKHTWFAEGTTSPNSRTPGSMGEGFWERYGIPACIHELNANYIVGLKEPATAERWQAFGADLPRVLFEYFE